MSDPTTKSPDTESPPLQHGATATAFAAPGRPRRDLATLESLVEHAVAKISLLEDALLRIEETHATKDDLKAVYAETRKLQRTLEEHMRLEASHHEASARRDAALMDILSDVIARMPLPSSPASSLASSLEASDGKPSSPKRP